MPYTSMQWRNAHWVGLVKKLRAPNSYRARAPHQPQPIAQKIRNVKYAG